jgi:DNA-binding MarR family transcriptional regulator
MSNHAQSPCDNMGLLIAKIKNKMRKRMNDELKAYDLTAEQRAILLILCNKGEMTQAQICELTSMEPSNLSTTLKRLKGKNYIEKIDHPNDPRAYLIKATKLTQALANDLSKLGEKIRSDLIKGIDESDLHITCETLKKLDCNL